MASDWPQPNFNAQGTRANLGLGTNMVTDLTSWTPIAGFPYMTGGAIHGGVVAALGYVCFGSLDGYLYCLNAVAGTLNWRKNLGAAINGTPCIDTASSVVVAGASNGRVDCYDLATGTQQWTHTEGSAVDSSPVIVSGTVYYGETAGTVHARTLSTGVSSLSTALGSAINTPLAFYNSKLYVSVAAITGGTRARVLALNPGTGISSHAFATGGSQLGPPQIIVDSHGTPILTIPSDDHYFYGYVADTNSAGYPLGQQFWIGHQNGDVSAPVAFSLPDAIIMVGQHEWRVAARILATFDVIWVRDGTQSSRITAGLAIGGDGTAGHQIVCTIWPGQDQRFAVWNVVHANGGQVPVKKWPNDNSYAIGTATESGTTATVQTLDIHNNPVTNTFLVGDPIMVTGVGVSGYNGSFFVTGVSSQHVSYGPCPGGLGNSSGGRIGGPFQQSTPCITDTGSLAHARAYVGGEDGGLYAFGIV